MLMQIAAHPPSRGSQSSYEIAVPGSPAEVALVPRDAFTGLPATPPLERHRWARSGIYVLLERPSAPWRIYVGHTSDFLRRMPEHDDAPQLDWERALLAFVPNLSTGQARQFERHLITELRNYAPTDEYPDLPVEVVNTNVPGKNVDDEPTPGDRRALIPVLGHVLNILGLPVRLEVEIK